MRRLSKDERRQLMRRVGRHLPLLRVGTGHLLVGRSGDMRTVELWCDGVFLVGYLWRHGHVRDATLVLPIERANAAVFVDHRNAA